MLAAALVCCLLSAPQDSRGFVADHLRCVRAERTNALFELLAGVDAAGQTATCAQILARQPAGLGAAAKLSLRDIARATRELQGLSWSAVQSLADSLDLSLQPGVFEARTEGRGEALTVRVHSLWGGAEAPDLTLTLTWISPSGEREVARREPVAAEFVPGVGFELYVRSPLSEPGTWLLEPCVEVVERRGAERITESACGTPLPVACIADLDGRLGAARAFAPAGPAPTGVLLRALDRLRSLGSRTSAALGPAAMLALLEGSAPSTLARPSLLSYVDSAGAQSWIWSVRPQAEIERIVCLLVSEAEAVDVLFAGVLGARWSAFAEQHQALLFAARLPPGALGGGARGLFDKLAAEAAEVSARARADVEPAIPLPLFVVARAETAGRLQLALGGGEYPFEGLVISAVVRRPTAATVYPGVPRLLLSPGAVAEQEAGLHVGPGAELTLFNDLDLPLHMGAWLAR